MKTSKQLLSVHVRQRPSARPPTRPIMVELQIQPLDLSCPAKKLPEGLGGLLGPLCLKKDAAGELQSSPVSSSSRRLSGGSDDVTVTSTDRSPSGSPLGEPDSDNDSPRDLSREQTGPARKRFLSKFFKDPRGRSSVQYCY